MQIIFTKFVAGKAHGFTSSFGSSSLKFFTYIVHCLFHVSIM